MHTRIALALVAALALTAAGCSSSGTTSTTSTTDSIPAPSAPAAETPAPEPPAAEPPRVADLIAQLGCDGGPIETQLYARETGRCQLDGGEVTIATFDTPDLRDEWTGFVRDLGGNLVAGDSWAAWVGSPDTAATVAETLGGEVI